MNRSIHIDIIRGALILLMAIYHAFYIMVMFNFVELSFYSGFWWIFPRLIAAGFVFLSGWNLAAKKARSPAWKGFAKRSVKLGLTALGISAVTYPVFGTGFVFFGVIHLLALGSILAFPVADKPVLSMLIAIASLIGGLALGSRKYSFFWLAWLGFRPNNLYPADYLPLLPWFSFIAFGISAYCFFQARFTKSILSTRQNKPKALALFFSFLGKHSLKIYLIHLPVLYGIGFTVWKLLG